MFNAPRGFRAPSRATRPRPIQGQALLARKARRRMLAVIAGGGALGSLARWGLSAALPHHAGQFPWDTFLVNVSGCLLIGALMALLADVAPPSTYARPFLGVGVLGGYTTFSTFMLDSRALLMDGRAALAGAYLASSLAAGLAAVWVGQVGARAAARVARGSARAADAPRRRTARAGSGEGAEAMLGAPRS